MSKQGWRNTFLCQGRTGGTLVYVKLGLQDDLSLPRQVFRFPLFVPSLSVCLCACPVFCPVSLYLFGFLFILFLTFLCSIFIPLVFLHFHHFVIPCFSSLALCLLSRHFRWFRCFTISKGRLHVVRMELLCKMPAQKIRLNRVLSDSGQHRVDLSPTRNYNFGWDPNFIEPPSFLVQMF